MAIPVGDCDPKESGAGSSPPIPNNPSPPYDPVPAPSAYTGTPPPALEYFGG